MKVSLRLFVIIAVILVSVMFTACENVPGVKFVVEELVGDMEGVVDVVEATVDVDVLVILAVDVDGLYILDVEALFVAVTVLVKRAVVEVVSGLLGLLLELLVKDVVAVAAASGVIIRELHCII